jgi:hypothetical protein
LRTLLLSCDVVSTRRRTAYFASQVPDGPIPAVTAASLCWTDRIDAHAMLIRVLNLSRRAVWETAASTAERVARRADHFALAIVVRVWGFSFAAEDALAITEGVPTRTHALPAHAGAVQGASVAA